MDTRDHGGRRRPRRARRPGRPQAGTPPAVGSSKARGAFANLLLRDVPRTGVVAASGGNHGVAVAYAAMALGVPATIFVPTISAPAKIDRIRRYGADLVVEGARYADALALSEQRVARSHARPIPAFGKAETRLGAGSVGRELERQTEGIDTVLGRWAEAD